MSFFNQKPLPRQSKKLARSGNEGFLGFRHSISSVFSMLYVESWCCDLDVEEMRERRHQMRKIRLDAALWSLTIQEAPPVLYSYQNLIENAFFEWLGDTLSKYRVVIIADRGFRRASLLKHLQELGLDYIIRVAGNVWASTNKNARERYSGILGEIKLKAGERKYLRHARYHKTLQISTHLVLGRLPVEKGKKIEPWYRDVQRFQESLSLV